MMAIKDKLMFWKKTDEGADTPPPPSDWNQGYGLENDPYADPFGQQEMPSGMGFKREAAYPQQNQQYPSNPPFQGGYAQPSPPFGGRVQQFEPASNDRNMDLLISKLDQIKLVLESINSRLQNIERGLHESDKRW